MNPVTKVYRGILIRTWQDRDEGESEARLMYLQKGASELENLSYDIARDLPRQGCYVVARYWISEVDIPREQLADDKATTLMGLCDAKSTWEHVSISGHELLDRLRGHIGEYLHLEVDYYRGEEPERPRS